jgi:ferredoxin
MAKVTFEREGITVEAKPGQSLLDVAESAGVTVFRGMWPELHCGGMKGWCNRCKVWVKGERGAVNPPTVAERRPRISGRVSGTMRLACQVAVSGDVTVHTRAGGPPVRTNMVWEEVPGPTKWKERWAKRNEKAAPGESDDEGDAAEAAEE